jgi:hypothetical protein
MEYAYLAYQDPKQKWYNILGEIYDVSKTHSISFNRRAVLYKRVSKYELKTASYNVSGDEQFY